MANCENSHCGTWHTVKHNPLWQITYCDKWSIVTNDTLWQLTHCETWHTVKHNTMWQMTHYNAWHIVTHDTLWQMTHCDTWHIVTNETVGHMTNITPDTACPMCPRVDTELQRTINTGHRTQNCNTACKMATVSCVQQLVHNIIVHKRNSKYTTSLYTRVTISTQHHCRQ